MIAAKQGGGITGWLGWLALAAIALAVASFSLGAAFTYGVANADPSSDARVQGLLFASLDVLKTALFLIAPVLWAGGARMHAAACRAVALCLAVLAVGVVASTALTARADLAAAARAREIAAAGHDRAVTRLETELASVERAPPAAVTMAEIAALKTDRLWTATAGCTEVTGQSARAFCAGYNRAFAQLAAGERATELRRQIETLRAERKGETVARAVSPEIVAVARFTGVDEELIAASRAILIAVLVELGLAVLLPAVVSMRPGRNRSARAAEDGEAGATEVGKRVTSGAEREDPNEEGLCGSPPVAAFQSPVAAGLGAFQGSAANDQGTLPEESGEEASGSPQRAGAGFPGSPAPASAASATSASPPCSPVPPSDPCREAVRAFLALLERDPQGRVHGADLERHYRMQANQPWWRDMSRTAFGMHAREVIKELGGERVRSNGIAYKGIKLPASWGIHAVSTPATPMAAASARASASSPASA